MKLSSLAPLLVLPFVAASASAGQVDERAAEASSATAAQAIAKSANQVISLIDTIGDELEMLKPGGLLPKGVKQILDNEDKITTALQGAAKNAQGASRFSASQARTVSRSISMLTPGFSALGDNLKQHKASFKRVALIFNFQKQLAQALEAQQTAVQSLGKALAPKFPASQRRGIQSTISAISAQLGKTIMVFGGK